MISAIFNSTTSRSGLRACAVLLATFFITACGHFDKSSPDPGPVSGPPPVSDSGAQPVPNAEAVKEVRVAEASPVNQDLISRIRDGFALPAFNSKHIRQYERWNSQHPTYLNNLFARAEPFLYHIVEEIEKRKLPMELALVPAIESAYKPAAVSRSSAAGLWQFVPITAREFKLEKDWWYDARLDPLRATNAALDYLERLNKMFDGDWLLTLAAYNAGQGTIKKAISRKRPRGNKRVEYQDLKLRRETTHYVPKLYALRNIILRPEQYSVSLPTIANEPYFAVMDLPGQIDLQKFSELSEIPQSTLRHMNAGHRRWATSPSGPHRLLVPLESQVQARAAIDQLATQPEIQYHHHQIASGDTLSGISRRYGVSVAALQQTNNLKGTNIREGRSLIIPVRQPGIEPAVAKTEVTNGENKIVHHVARGDTLWSIAQRYRVKVEQLRAWNQLAVNDILNLNQVLTVFIN